MANFEEFSRRLLPLKAQPYVTIQMRGAFALNRPAYELMARPDAVGLLYDREEGIVGMRPLANYTGDAYLVRAASSSPAGPWLVSAMAFTRYYDIDLTQARRWPAYLDGDVLCIDISTPGEPVTSNRRGSARPDTA